MTKNFKDILHKSKEILSVSQAGTNLSAAKFDENTTFIYGITNTPFGKILLAKSYAGISDIWFINKEKQFFVTKLFNKYPKSQFIEDNSTIQKLSDKIFVEKDVTGLNICPKGTEFQLKVWQSLLKIPKGSIVSYCDIAKDIQKPTAQRAVGTAVGQNPVLYLIPCHRVIRSNGEIGGFSAGVEVKTHLLNAEINA